MRQWGWLAACGILLALGGVALYLAGFREILFYGMLLICPLLHLALHGGHRHGTARDEHKHQAGGL